MVADMQKAGHFDLSTETTGSSWKLEKPSSHVFIRD